MPELIDRQAALEKMCGDCKSGYDGHCPHPFGMCHEYESILQVPAIEDEPVRHGRWIFKKGDNKSTVDGWICTSCKFGFNTKVPYFEVFKYCPMCGSRMDGGADNG